MSQDVENELISALLDGELTPAEQARVEELLLDSAEHRQTFKELRALRDQLQSLPSYSVGGDFADSVLQQIERREPALQSNVGDHTDLEQESQEHVATLPSSRNVSRSPRGMKRGLAWAAVAIAASLLILLIYGPLNQRPQREAADLRVKPSDNKPSNDVARGKSQLKDLDRAGLSQLPAKQFADSVEEDLERNAGGDAKALPGSQLPLVLSAKAAGAIHLPEEFAAEKEIANQRPAFGAENTDQPGLVSAGAIGGGADDAGGVDLYYVVDIPGDPVASEILAATLVENGIAMVDLEDQLATRRRSLRQIEATLDRFKDVDVRYSATELSLQNDKRDELKTNLDEFGNSEILVLNATPQQIKETLAGLKAHGCQWESRQQLDRDAELLLEGKSQPGGEMQLEVPRRAASESGDEQLDAKAATRGLRAETASTNVPKDASRPEPALEADTKRELREAPLPGAIAGSASSNRAAGGPAIKQSTTRKNEIGKAIDEEGDRLPSAHFAKSAGEKANYTPQPTPRSFAYRLKAPTRQDSGGVFMREKQEKPTAGPLPVGAERPDSAVKDRANKPKSLPRPDGRGEGESRQPIDGPELADAKTAATGNAPLVRSIFILRSIPPAPKEEVRKVTP